LASITISPKYCKACGYCLFFCKHGVLAQGNTANEAGYFSVIVQDESKCIGCGICSKVCGESAFTISK
jgi:2-oxoglutarate ferredoxin oxidoreductase subunit delta